MYWLNNLVVTAPYELFLSTESFAHTKVGKNRIKITDSLKESIINSNIIIIAIASNKINGVTKKYYNDQ